MGMAGSPSTAAQASANESAVMSFERSRSCLKPAKAVRPDIAGTSRAESV
jgi:hypothetical protein